MTVDLINQISRRRAERDQAFFDDIQKLRARYGDQRVDQALARLQEQRDAITAQPKIDGRTTGSGRHNKYYR